MAADDARLTESQSEGVRDLRRLFALQKTAYAANPYPSRDERAAWLETLVGVIESNEAGFIESISADFGHRSRHETLIAEIMVTVAGTRHAKKHLRQWMRPRGVATPFHLAPSSSRLEPQPLGVVGVISPWNYPLQLAFAPAAAALAAGNRVLIKPSELTPRFSEVLKQAVGAAFPEDVLAVVTGGVETGAAFSETPFDHLLFTGSTAVGMRVAQAAAKTLTPVTLELGGKSPAIIDDSADLGAAAKSIAHGKMLNAGQTCVAPDYVLAPPAKLDSVAAAIGDAARAMFPAIDTTGDYSSIISDRHFARLKAMVDEAKDRGVKVIEIGSSNALHPQRKLPLTMMIDPPRDLAVMREEIFGPILPILPAATAEEAVREVNAGERPLALYWFGTDNDAQEKVLKRTVAGGVTINDTLWHLANENLPFGGVGKSGIGAYHGAAGFNTFSHLKPVLRQSRLSGGALMHPPYTPRTEKLLSILRRII